MHRRAVTPGDAAAAWARAAIWMLATMQRLILLAGVFLFVLAMAATALEGSANRTVNLEYSHSDVSH